MNVNALTSSTDARTLPLIHVALRADAGGGLARVVLEQRFRNAHAEPLAVSYSLPLPREAAVSGFAFRIGDRRIVGEVDRREQARERFEQALADGHTAALVEQDRSTLFTQHLGNVPPGVEVVAEITIDQRLLWTDEGSWEWRFPTTVAPRYLGVAGRVSDPERVAQDVAEQRMPVRASFAVQVRDELDGRLPHSPTHALRASNQRIEQAEAAGVPLDRDIVVRWKVARAEPGVRIETARGPDDAVHALLTLVPPARAGAAGPVPRDLIVLLDVSGSMAGEPLAQARRVASALVATLGDRDSLEMIAFASRPTCWKPRAVQATSEAKRDAQAWIDALSASGGTEMRAAIEAALTSLREDAQRQIVMVTDGHIGFENEVVSTILQRLPRSSRVHVVGVGSAPNRTLTAGAPRAGHGVEVLVGPGEDAERAAARIVARTDAPLAVELALAGSALRDHAPARLPDLFAGAPALVALRLAGEGDLVVRWRTDRGLHEQRLPVPSPGEHDRRAIATLYGRESVEDLEAQLAAGGDPDRLGAAIERLGLAYGIATRVTSWIAVSEEPTVDPRAPIRRVRMPHELPHGSSAEGFGLATGSAPQAHMPLMGKAMMMGMPSPMMGPAGAPADGGRRTGALGPVTRARAVFGRLLSRSGSSTFKSVRGTIVRRDAAGLLLVELLMTERCSWSPTAEVEITWEDGSTSRAIVRMERSSSQGPLEAGVSVRLAVETTDTRTPRSMAFELSGERWLVTL